MKSSIWHRQCFCCVGCKCSLTSTLDDAFERCDEIYCKPCLQKTFPNESFVKPSIYYDPKKIPGRDQDQSCTACQGAVFEAEKITFANKLFHQSCFNCNHCEMKLDSLRAESFGAHVYCKTCHNNLQATGLRFATVQSKPMMIDKSDPSACPRCGSKVFEAEKMMSKSRVFHKQCFSCCKCNHSLDYTNSMEGPDSEVYCKTCYVKEYFTGGRNKFGDSKSGPEVKGNDPESCPKCHRKVYEMDKVQLSSHCYHKQCLSCSHCLRQLDFTNYFDATARDGNIYCQNCYEVRYGVKGHPLSLPDAKKIVENSSSCKCPKCGGSVYEAEKVITSIGAYHATCVRCATCSRALDQVIIFN